LVGGVIQVLALPILAVGMIGLVSTMTSNVLERTREIGVLRSLGSRSRHLRRIFRAEGTTLSVAGWLVGLPIGYGLARLIVWLFGLSLHATLDLQFPIWLMFTALLGVVIVARIALRPPLRHATRMQPGVAIRYE
jgi:putative ABC transport system permease protein